MDGVTDVVFRQIITQIGRPDVFFTEFTNVEGNSLGCAQLW
jgi:tRNA-dihydrouridine synthase